jgi:hypothetical protein
MRAPREFAVCGDIRAREASTLVRSQSCRCFAHCSLLVADVHARWVCTWRDWKLGLSALDW